MLVVVLVLMTRGVLDAAITAVVILLLLVLLMVRDSHGKNALSRISNQAGWWFARSRGTNVYRSGPTGRTPWGTNQLQAWRRRSASASHRDSYNRPFALLFPPGDGGLQRRDRRGAGRIARRRPEQIDVWVADWGHWLANLADEAGVESATVTIETAPDSGTRLRRESGNEPRRQRTRVRSRKCSSRPSTAIPRGSSTIRAYVTITFSAAARQGGKRRKPDEM
ncbi:hypothetical protein JM654_04125, partial [Microbacterium oxydans]|nr:hypothetical protein [Microbacterium oxydans]